MDQLLKDMALLARAEDHKVELIGFDLLVDFGNDVSFSQAEPQVFAMDAVDVQLVSAADAGFHRMPHNSLARRPGPDEPFLKEDLLGGFQHFDARQLNLPLFQLLARQAHLLRTACGTLGWTYSTE